MFLSLLLLLLILLSKRFCGVSGFYRIYLSSFWEFAFASAFAPLLMSLRMNLSSVTYCAQLLLLLMLLTRSLTVIHRVCYYITGKSRITNSTFWYPLKNKVFHFWFEDIWECWAIFWAGPWTKLTPMIQWDYAKRFKIYSFFLKKIVKYFSHYEVLENLNFCI